MPLTIIWIWNPVFPVIHFLNYNWNQIIKSKQPFLAFLKFFDNFLISSFYNLWIPLFFPLKIKSLYASNFLQSILNLWNEWMITAIKKNACKNFGDHRIKTSGRIWDSILSASELYSQFNSTSGYCGQHANKKTKVEQIR